MKSIIQSGGLVLCIFLFSSAFGQVAPLASGSVVTIQNSVAKQVGFGSITWDPRDSHAFKVAVKENGNQEYVGGDGIVNHQFDKSFTNITTRGKDIPPEWRFAPLPQGKQLQPGMTWSVPPWKYKTDCQTMEVKYTGTSKDGPEVRIAVNGTEQKVQTVQMNFEAYLPTCQYNRRWRMTHEVLYSPELNILVGSKHVGFESSNPNRDLSEGSGWAVTAIQTPK